MAFNTSPQVALRVQGVDLPVYRSTGNVVDGIAVGQMGKEVFITITSGGEAFYVRLRGDQIDNFAGLIASAVIAATHAAHPSLGAIQ
jgi:hypothetical protein